MIGRKINLTLAFVIFIPATMLIFHGEWRGALLSYLGGLLHWHWTNKNFPKDAEEGKP